MGCRIKVGRIWVRVGAAGGRDIAFDEAETQWATPEVAGSQEHRHAEMIRKDLRSVGQ
jgi:hypothetical protein